MQYAYDIFGFTFELELSTIGARYLWTYVYNIVLFYASKRCQRAEVTTIRDNAKLPEIPVNPFSESCTEALLPSYNRSISESHADNFSAPPTRFTEDEKVSTSIRLKELLKTVVEKVSWKRVFAPSTIAAIVGFLVGVVPQARRSMIRASAPLRVIEDSAYLLGDGSVPVLTLIVGGNLKKGLKESGTPVSLILGIVLVRYILLPLSGILVVKGATHFGFVSSNPLYQFVLLLQFAELHNYLELVRSQHLENYLHHYSLTFNCLSDLTYPTLLMMKQREKGHL